MFATLYSPPSEAEEMVLTAGATRRDPDDVFISSDTPRQVAAPVLSLLLVALRGLKGKPAALCIALSIVSRKPSVPASWWDGDPRGSEGLRESLPPVPNWPDFPPSGCPKRLLFVLVAASWISTLVGKL